MPDDQANGRLIFVRHGRTEWNAEGRCQGWEDVALDDKGRHQALLVADRLCSWRVDRIVSSDLGRARETAEIIARTKGLTFSLEPNLREVHFGECQGLRVADLAGTELGRRWEEWKLGRRYEALPGGEHPDATLARARQFLDPLVASLRGEHVVIVGHGSTFRLIFSHLLQLPPKRWRYLDQGNTALTVFDVQGDIITLALFNDTCHLHHHIAEQPGANLIKAE